MGTVDKQGVVTMQELLVSSLAQTEGPVCQRDKASLGRWQTLDIEKAEMKN